MRETVVGLGLLFCCMQSLAQEVHTLREAHAVGACVWVDMSLKITGELRVSSREKTVHLDLDGNGRFAFHEKVLATDAQGLPSRVARYYDRARMELKVHRDTSVRELRPERALIMAQDIDDATVTWSPAGPLTYEEWRLVGEHFDVLAVSGLFPERPVTQGAKWKAPLRVVQALGNLDALVQGELTCCLDRIENGSALLVVEGDLEGLAKGALVKQTHRGLCTVDLSTQRWTAVRWQIKEERQAGVVSPASTLTSVTEIVRRPASVPDTLSEAVTAVVAARPKPEHLLLTFRDTKNGLVFEAERGWYPVALTEHYAVYRLIEGGELVAQLNITPLPKAKPGDHVRPDELRQNIRKTSGLEIVQELQAGEVPAAQNHWAYRLSLLTRADDTDLLQNYYALAGPQGTQFLLTFTAEPRAAEKLGARDLALVGSARCHK